MKLVNYADEDQGKKLITGEAEEIKAIAGSLWRANKKRGGMKLFPYYEQKPRFRMGEIYGILIKEECNGYKGWLILNASGVVRELEEGADRL